MDDLGLGRSFKGHWIWLEVIRIQRIVTPRFANGSLWVEFLVMHRNPFNEAFDLCPICYKEYKGGTHPSPQVGLAAFLWSEQGARFT